jgi:sugar lactone lactonase YvrE
LAAEETKLTSIFEDKNCQFTGMAYSPSGRLFVNYPRWEDPHQFDLVEVIRGVGRPYPDTNWNSWTAKENGSNKWVCVQGIYVDDTNRLWVVDPAAPKMEKVVPNSAKLVCIDLKTDHVLRSYNLTDVAGTNSYLNDVRVDTHTKTAYLTESKNGGIVVVDLDSGDARLVLAKHNSVKTDPNYKFTINGAELMRNGKPFKGNSDGIALSPDHLWLYYKPLSDTKLSRIHTADLRNADLSPGDLEKKVENLGANFTASDGMIFDHQGNIYLSDAEHDSIVRVTPDLKWEAIAHDRRLMWPDTFAFAPSGSLCVTCSQIQNMAWCHDGKSNRTTPYTIYRLAIEDK